VNTTDLWPETGLANDRDTGLRQRTHAWRRAPRQRIARRKGRQRQHYEKAATNGKTINLLLPNGGTQGFTPLPCLGGSTPRPLRPRAGGWLCY